jgi:hypothetical protein
MTPETAFPLVILALAVFVPLGREYLAFRREWGIGRLAALGTSFSLFPALGVGLAISLPLAAHPPVRWIATVIVTLLAYALAVAVLRPRLAPAPVRSRREP